MLSWTPSYAVAQKRRTRLIEPQLTSIDERRRWFGPTITPTVFVRHDKPLRTIPARLITSRHMSIIKSIAGRFISITPQRYIGYSIWVMILCTTGLWFGDTTVIPRVAITDHFSLTPAAFLIAIAAVALFCLIRKSWAWAIVSLAFLLVFITDQLTLQPWAYQYAIFAVIFATGGKRDIELIRLLAISIYLLSGFGKFDYQFAYTVGTNFLSTITFGGIDDWPRPIIARLALLLPVVEMAAGLLLINRRTRPIGAAVAIGMHATLIGILGPWGENQSTGVIAWNILLIGQTFILFLQKQDTVVPSKESKTLPIAVLVTLIVVTGPLLERSGYWDHWLAWSLYAPHTSRIDVELTPAAMSRATVVTPFCDQDQDADRWHRLDLSEMILTHRGVPVYPQSRYQLKLIENLAKKYQWNDGIRVVVLGTSDRWTGRRTETYLVGKNQISNYIQKTWQ